MWHCCSTKWKQAPSGGGLRAKKGLWKMRHAANHSNRNMKWFYFFFIKIISSDGRRRTLRHNFWPWTPFRSWRFIIRALNWPDSRTVHWNEDFGTALKCYLWTLSLTFYSEKKKSSCYVQNLLLILGLNLLDNLWRWNHNACPAF